MAEDQSEVLLEVSWPKATRKVFFFKPIHAFDVIIIQSVLTQSFLIFNLKQPVCFDMRFQGWRSNQ